jgi:hypothetical protein
MIDAFGGFSALRQGRNQIAYAVKLDDLLLYSRESTHETLVERKGYVICVHL